MNRLLLSAVAGILTLALSSPAWAGGHGHSYGSSSGGSHSFVSHSGTSRSYTTNTSYHTRFGTKFSHGYYFSGPNHHFWTSRNWSSRYGCYCYWYPGNSSWYYWSAAQNGYYPIGYIAIAPPVVTVVPVAVAPGVPVPPVGPLVP